MWISKATVAFTAAYMAKYMAKDMLIAHFRKGERRYSISKGIRVVWPKLQKANNSEIKYNFNYKPDDRKLVEMAHMELINRQTRRKTWVDGGDLKPDKTIKRRRLMHKRRKLKHNKSNRLFN